VWEILGSHGVTAAALNWWATWPAPAHGAPGARVVSERAFPRMEAGRPPDRDISPESLQSELAASFAGDLAASRAVVERAAEDAGAAGEVAGPAASGMLADAWHARVGLRLWRNGDAQVVLLYLPGLDIARRTGGPWSAQAALAVLGPLLGQAMAGSGPDDLVLVVGDPGRSGNGRGRIRADAPAGREVPGPPGVLLVWGRRVPGAAAGRGSAGLVSLEDLAPTLLALAGLPQARDLPGRAVLDFLTVSDPARRERPAVASYGGAAVPEEEISEDPFDEEVLDRLRSLGYIR
jgi:hypothetical protein